MDEQRIQAYANLIQQLLTHPNEVAEILQANGELVDEGLLQIMELQVQQLAENDDQKAQDAAKFLRHLRSQLAEALEISESSPSTNYSSEDYVNFLMEVLQATADSKGDPKVLYSLLQVNLDKLDDNLAHILRNWATAKFSEVETDIAELLTMGNFCARLNDFPLGNEAHNIEIALAGYEAVLKVLSRESNRESWATMKYNLGYAYCKRIRGDQAENLENAITAYHLALEVYTKEDFPIKWGRTQWSLGIAYKNRIRGDQAENLESAIAAFNMALSVYTKKDFPIEWAMIQNNLGIAYSERIRGDQAENLENAIAAYHLALKVYTKEDFPIEWAGTQCNLGEAYRDRIRGDRAENLENAIAAYHLALEVYTKEDFPIKWGRTQWSLGIAYKNRIRGDQAENLENAIAAYHLALEVETKEDSPNWARIQNNLGGIYNERIRGDQAENLKKAIAAFNMALSVYTKKDFPIEWAMIQNNLGIAYSERIRGDQAENLENAIAAYHLALKVYTKEDFPIEWAGTQCNLGEAYRDRIRGDRAENLENAIAAYHLALEVETKKDFPIEWSRTQNSLGIAYSERIRGDQAENLENAIAAYHLALSVRTKKDFPVEWAGTQCNLGIAYYKRIRGDSAQNWENAIAAFNMALEVYTKKDFPIEWAQTQKNLASTYSEAIRGDRAENLENAIAVFNLVLEVYTKKDFPIEWAETQHTLGMTYSEAIRGDRAENLENAIAVFNLVLEVYTKKDFPSDWAGTQGSLGIAYRNRIRGDRAENLENAIAAYHLALQVYTKKDFPIDWARTQNNLGIAYCNRIMGDQAENLENAIAAHNLALEVYTKEDFPMYWAGTQNSLGIAYWRNIRGNQTPNMEDAITAYHLALQVYTKKDFPIDWARTQNNLGIAYCNRIMGDQAENLENAIAAYHLALQVYTKKDFPIDWARTQNNLGIAYSERIMGDRAQNLKDAIAAFHLALEVDTPEASPVKCLNTSRSLGNLHFKEGNWRPAIAAYEKAITAVELSRSWSTDDDRRQEILTGAIQVYQNIVQACVNTNQIEKALEYVERSRSRRLVDLMASNDLYSQGKIPAEVEEWLEKHEAIQQQMNQLWEQQQGDSHTEGKELTAATRGRAAMEARNQQIAELEAQKQEVYKKIRSLDRVLADEIQVTPLEFEKIQALIQQPTTAILSFYTTNKDTYLFVVRQNGVKVHIYSGLGFGKLQNWVEKNWFNSYLSSYKEWQQQMPGFLEEVASKFRLGDLCKFYLKDIEELILIPHQYLHFLPWSAMPVINSKFKSDTSHTSRRDVACNVPTHTFLGDYFRIRTLASCQILDFCTQRPEVTTAEYGIVEDTRNDLPCSSYEAQHIAKMYGVRDNQRLRGEAATVDSYKLLLSQVKRLLSTHHAQSRTDNCMESALVLADGRITLGQLLSPAFRFPDLDEVFIDCCETNFGVVQISDDVLTLNTGFLCAGARGVISSLWSVDDLGTCLFSIFYHQLRKEGKNRSEALQMAQRQLRELTGKELRKQYKKELEEALGEKLDTAYEQLKEIEVRRDSYAKNSAEYQELEEERAKLDNIYRRIYRTKNEYLKAACKKEYPFEHPVYWSAFICAGLS